MAKYIFDEKKHGEPVDAYDLDLYYYVVRPAVDGRGAELLVFEKQKPVAVLVDRFGSDAR